MQIFSDASAEPFYAQGIDRLLLAGVAAAFRGNGMNCVKVCPELGLKFGIASLISQCMKSGSGRETTPTQKFMSGCIGGAIGQVRHT